MSYSTKKIQPDTGKSPDTFGHSKSTTTTAKSWGKRALELATWAMEYLPNRKDAWGYYLSLHLRTKKQNAKTAKGELTLRELKRHFQGKDVGDLCGLHAISPKNRSRWLVIDIDCHDGDEGRKTQNRAAAKLIYMKAKNTGLKPLLISSNGRGGYHLWVLFKKPLPTSKVYDLGQWLVNDWEELGLSERPEVFPKQKELNSETQYGNWIRLPGRHHTRNHWSNVWNGSRWLKGKEAIDVILKTTGVTEQVVADVINRASDEPTCEGGEEEVKVCSGFQTGDAELDRFAPYLRNVKKTDKGYTSSCPCPDHPDKRPSFWFNKSKDGKRTVFYCHAGCSSEKIINAVNELRKANRTSNGGETNSLVAELDRELFNVNLRKLNKQFIEALAPELLNELNDQLNIHVDALRAFDVGWCDASRCWTFPMRDGNGKVIGITYRSRKGKKFNHLDSQLGLFLPKGWKKFKGTVFVPEGVSDAAALHAMGIPVIGRFNNTQGAELLAEVFKQLKCEVVVLGENDGKRNGSWPGLEGAIAVSDKLARLLGRTVKWALPPEDVKDVRSWLISQGGSDE